MLPFAESAGADPPEASQRTFADDACVEVAATDLGAHPRADGIPNLERPAAIQTTHTDPSQPPEPPLGTMRLAR